MSDRFKFVETGLEGLYSIERHSLKDSRGFLNRFFCAREFSEFGFNKPIAQMNHTLTRKKGALRGMHFQYPPSSEIKVVTCIKGIIFDVAVDIRKNSPTFLNWYSLKLSAKNQKSLYIPEGFAHGFQALTEECELLYIHSKFYDRNLEGGFNAVDPMLSIDWPLSITEISERDKNHHMISEFEGLEIR